MDIESLKNELKTHSQEQLLDHWDSLSEEQKASLYNDLKSIDYAEVNGFFKACNESMRNAAEKVDEHLQPIPQDSLGSITRAGDETLDRYNKSGELSMFSLPFRILVQILVLGHKLGKYAHWIFINLDLVLSKENIQVEE